MKNALVGCIAWLAVSDAERLLTEGPFAFECSGFMLWHADFMCVSGTGTTVT